MKKIASVCCVGCAPPSNVGQLHSTLKLESLEAGGQGDSGRWCFFDLLPVVLSCVLWYGASMGGTLCNTSKMWVRQVRLMSHELKTTQKAQRPNKHHHHGDGAAHPSSSVGLMKSCRLRGGRPCACLFQCHRRSNLTDSINRKLSKCGHLDDKTFLVVSLILSLL